MNTVIETRRDFWTRIAMSEIEQAKIWRRARQYRQAFRSLSLAREWLSIARSA
ncbi:hypothetical protein [Pseudohoeflea coraliihabitans]|uniref:Uncharacterized protein n=1 Tax=Pseudohoeflea coraliihabitans TaxID=2860393 RepID=A0ABS6WIA3_9HYPH|nr:hypothetical protein [Pseudohoeflea sp. DP4N28-3]MBW3095672.1 hypothetical protein [Pseudohoeflea sp. DP4N28-3]